MLSSLRLQHKKSIKNIAKKSAKSFAENAAKSPHLPQSVDSEKHQRTQINNELQDYLLD